MDGKEYVITAKGAHLHLPANWFSTLCGRESIGVAPADSRASLCSSCRELDYQREFRSLGTWVSLPCSVGKCDRCRGRDCEHDCPHTGRDSAFAAWALKIAQNAGGMLLVLVVVLGVFG